MRTVSASQVSLFRECLRKFAFRYIGKLQTPQHPSAALGTEVDDTQLQPYLRDNRPLDYTRTSGYIAQPALEHLPAPLSIPLTVQQEFTFPSPFPDASLSFLGYIDVWLPEGGLPVVQSLTQIPTVVDFKTTGNWKYAKTAEDLRTDVQANLYATWAMHATGARVVDLVWLYLSTKKPYRAKPVHLRATAEDVVPQFLAIHETAVEIARLRDSNADPLSLPPSPHACGAFGGCPYRASVGGPCTLSDDQVVESQLAALRPRKNAMSITPSSATLSLVERLRAKAGGATPVAPPPAAEQLPMWADPVATPVDPLRAKALGVNPPESKLPPPPPPPVVAESAAPTAVETKPKRGPGRPKKDPVGADAAAFAFPPDSMTFELKGVTEANAPAALTAPFPDEGLLESISVTWGAEKFSPVPCQTFDVGPFEATGFRKKGETLAQATGRIYYELAAFAESAREAKALSYKKTLESFGSSR